VSKVLMVLGVLVACATARAVGADVIEARSAESSAVNGVASAVGYWKTIDDKTGKPRSIVKIWEQDGELRGRVERLIREPNEEQDPVCDKCKDERHNKKIIGMEFLWGFKREGAGWSDGWVLDPKNGSVYHATLELVEAGAKLRLFGYIRVVFKIGRSQTWERVKPEEFGL
jgi:uncharacterized protein (DUF2147 family)